MTLIITAKVTPPFWVNIYTCGTLERSELERRDQSLVWVNRVWRVDWHRDLGRICQGHAAIFDKYLLVRNFGTEQASDAIPLSSMGKSGAAIAIVILTQL